MHLIDSPTAKQGKFVKGNPTTGEEATKFTDSWCNAVQEELAAVVTREGLPLDKEDNTQVSKILSTKFSTIAGSYKNETSKLTLTKGSPLQLTNFQTSGDYLDLWVSFSAKASSSFSEAQIKISMSGQGVSQDSVRTTIGVGGYSHPVFLRMAVKLAKSPTVRLTATVNAEVLNGTPGTDTVTISDLQVRCFDLNHMAWL